MNARISVKRDIRPARGTKRYWAQVYTPTPLTPAWMTVPGDGRRAGYVLDTVLQVRGRDEPFLHRDRNTLAKVAEPTPNPLAQLRSASFKLT